MKKIAYIKRNISTNIDMGYIFTILFLIVGIMFNIYFCQSLLGIRR